MLMAILAPAARAAEPMLLADFDNAFPDTFSYKDEKGTVFNVSAAYTDKEKQKHLGLRYRIAPEGWAGWGMILKGRSAEGFGYLAFDLKGGEGGESFEIGMRDLAGKEKKFLISRFADPTEEWKEVLIPLSEFDGLNLASLDNINIGFSDREPEGLVYLDNIRFVGAPEGPAGETAASLANITLVDGFERTSPFDAYQVFQGDESTLNLLSSRLVYEGDYAMELEYKFSTSRPWGSWVSAVRHLRDPLDWSGVQEVKIWIKGDGSENDFRFRFTEPDGEAWEFVADDAFESTTWHLVSMPLNRFRLVTPTETNGTRDLGQVSSYQIDILSPTSEQTTGAKTTFGRVYVDRLYVAGERIRAVQAAPPETVPHLRLAVPTVGNVDFSLNAFTEYTFTPEEKSRVNHIAKLITSGKVGNYSARVEFASKAQEFGEASAFVGSSVTSTENRFPEAEIPSFQVMVNNLSPYLSNVTMGNIFVDYSPYTFAPVFGFKGASAEGDYDRLNYHVFALKHSLNSFSAGNRLRLISPHWRLTAYTVYWEQNARLADPSVTSGGNLADANASVLELVRVAQDLVYNLEVERKLLRDRITLRGLYGRNEYHQSATADFSDPFNPVFNEELARKLNPKGDIWRGKIQTDGLPWRGLALAYEYRDVATAYKPRYRQNPVAFDDVESDQWGHNLRATQYYRGWVFSNEYDTIRRHSSNDYFRHRYNWGIGHFGFRGLDVAFNQEYRREIYIFTSDRSGFTTDKNEKVIASEIYVRSQLTPRMAFWIKPRQERFWHPATNFNFVNDILHMKLEFYMSTHARLFAEHRISRFGEEAFEPQGFPFDDNFTRISFEVTF
jgi:hypothetical protein